MIFFRWDKTGLLRSLFFAVVCWQSTIAACASDINLMQLGIDGLKRTELIALLRTQGQSGSDQAIVARESMTSRLTTPNRDVSLTLADVDTRLFDEAIDEIARQRYGMLSPLFWHTDLDVAKKKAREENKPISMHRSEVIVSFAVKQYGRSNLFCFGCKTMALA